MDNLTLLTLAKSGNQSAKEALVKNNTSLVWSIAHRFSGRGYDVEDIFQIGCIGMIKAISGFNMDYGVQFSTYAVPLIIGEIKRFLRDDGLLKVGRSIKETALKISDIREKYLHEHGTEPTMSDLCAMLNIDRDTLIMAIEYSKPTLCFDSPVSNDSKTTIGETVCHEVNINEKMTENLCMKIAVEKLTYEEREFIHKRYYLEKTQREMASELNVSQLQICRKEKKILQKLREEFSL